MTAPAIGRKNCIMTSLGLSPGHDSRHTIPAVYNALDAEEGISDVFAVLRSFPEVANVALEAEEKSAHWFRRRCEIPGCRVQRVRIDGFVDVVAILDSYSQASRQSKIRTTPNYEGWPHNSCNLGDTIARRHDVKPEAP